MTKIWEYDDEAKVWRLTLVSRIQNNTLRRAALIVTLPFMLLWWFVSLFFPPLLFATKAIMYIALIPIYPIWHLFKSFPVETFRSFARRWNAPLEPGA